MEEFSRNKAALKNISATPNKQKALWGNIWAIFHLATPKTAFLVRNLPIDPRNLGILHNKQGHSIQFQKKEQRRPPPSPW